MTLPESILLIGIPSFALGVAFTAAGIWLSRRAEDMTRIEVHDDEIGYEPVQRQSEQEKRMALYVATFGEAGRELK